MVYLVVHSVYTVQNSWRTETKTLRVVSFTYGSRTYKIDVDGSQLLSCKSKDMSNAVLTIESCSGMCYLALSNIPVTYVGT